jgi:hypothetical protein
MTFREFNNLKHFPLKHHRKLPSDIGSGINRVTSVMVGICYPSFSGNYDTNGNSLSLKHNPTDCVNEVAEMAQLTPIVSTLPIHSILHPISQIM